ncbi:hypothetical protein EVAR_77667_1 [Eumeta japonica]|uniref:(+)RNA virus helicase C-terminal domain-containing protein n=1 Tax=Eumeta variegata TaxID=151549 RepID=A0A4C2AA92_EUMVA|nr:hypothetical protein EVAR_77667_1 [Eumeta japonica]
MASILVNGFKEHTRDRLLIDEAMMNHFGAIITAALLAKAKELLLIGDINQTSHRQTQCLPMSYEKPNAVAKSPENCYDLTETPWMWHMPSTKFIAAYTPHRKGPDH